MQQAIKPKIKNTRQEYHLTGEKGWINDPNGLIYYKGQYHVFYQHHPYSTQWGPMHWGHAVSNDLVKWEYLPIALKPDSAYDEDGCFSGSAILFDDKLYLMYTGFTLNGGGDNIRQVQCLAVSDNGVDFKKLGVVISTQMLPKGYSLCDFRDPKVFRKDGEFICYVAAKFNGGKGRILVYRSEDLLNWHYCKDLFAQDLDGGEMIECPDYFEPYNLTMFSYQFSSFIDDGNKNIHTTWYTLDNINFNPLDYGFDFYAPQTIFDGKNLIMIAWQQMWDRNIPSCEYGWAGGMTLPRIIEASDGKLLQRPIDLSKYYKSNEYYNLSDEKLDLLGDKYVLKLNGNNIDDLDIELMSNGDNHVAIKLTNGILTFDRSNCGTIITGAEKDNDSLKGIRKMPITKSLKEMIIIVDNFSIEIFCDGVSMTNNIYPISFQPGISISSRSKDIKLIKHELA